MNDDLAVRAKALAHSAHKGQLLFKKKAPIIMHIEEVASLVEQVDGSQEQIAAAWLHDALLSSGKGRTPSVARLLSNGPVIASGETGPFALAPYRR